MSGIKGSFHAPDIVVICIDGYKDQAWSGRLYHKYQIEPIAFAGSQNLIRRMGRLYDEIGYPQPGVSLRSFTPQPQRMGSQAAPVQTEEEMAEHRGEAATFCIYVRYRQRATWQGELQHLESGDCFTFRSELEMLKLIDSFLPRE